MKLAIVVVLVLGLLAAPAASAVADSGATMEDVPSVIQGCYQIGPVCVPCVSIGGFNLCIF